MKLPYSVGESKCCELYMFRNFGWKGSGDNIEIVWDVEGTGGGKGNKPTKCGCKTGCDSKRCSCHNAHNSCSARCTCTSCRNPHNGSGICANCSEPLPPTTTEVTSTHGDSIESGSSRAQPDKENDDQSIETDYDDDDE